MAQRSTRSLAAQLRPTACTMTLHHTCINPSSADVHSCGSTLYRHHQRRRGTHEICAQRPSTPTHCSVCRGSEWLNSTQSGFRCPLTGLICKRGTQKATFNTCVWNSLREFQWVEYQQLGITQLLQRLLRICVFMPTSQKIRLMHVTKKRIKERKQKNTMRYWFESMREV